MPALHAVKRKRKKQQNIENLFWEVNSLIGNVYKKMSKAGGLLHGLMRKSRKTRTHNRRRHK